MDVNNIRQNVINTNVYGSNSAGEAVVPQVQPIETKTSSENEAKNKEYGKGDLEKALKMVNNFLKDERTHAEYSYHKELKTTMIKIINEDTKEVILEIPPKKILDMVASICKQFGLLDKRA